MVLRTIQSKFVSCSSYFVYATYFGTRGCQSDIVLMLRLTGGGGGDWPVPLLLTFFTSALVPSTESPSLSLFSAVFNFEDDKDDGLFGTIGFNSL